MRFRKACFFLPSGHRDGAELSALECMEALLALGVEVLVILPQRGPLREELRGRGIPFHILPYKVWIEPPVPFLKKFLVTLWNLVLTYPALWLAVRGRCDLVVTNTININVGALVAKILGLPHLWYIREFGQEDHGWQFHLGERAAYFLMNRLTTAAVCVSQAVARKYRALLPAVPVYHAYQPINLPPAGGADPHLPKTDRRFTCIMVGRLQAGKRQEEAVRALGVLGRLGVKVDLWLVGGADPAYRAFLEQLVKDAGLTDQVRFIGPVKNARPYIEAADVLLLCSRCEAFARVVVEALKVGKPVVGTRSGGTVEQIQEGLNGWLYTPGDYVELAAKIKLLSEAPELAREMGKQGQEGAWSRFTPAAYRDRLREVLLRL